MELRLAFSPGCGCSDEVPSVLTWTGPPLPLEGPPEAWRSLVVGASMARLKALLQGAQDETARFFLQLSHLKHQGLVEEVLTVDGVPCLARRVVAGFRPHQVPGDRRLALSRYALLRRSVGGLMLESPLSLAQVRILDPSLLPALAGPVARGEPWVEFLAQSGLLVPNDAVEPAEALYWEFHDLLFHARSRRGRHANPVGGLAADPAPPEVRAPVSEDFVPLEPVDLAAVEARDPSLTQVLESRRSLRTPAAQLNLARLSEFLYRTAREVDGRRPYPTGGNRRELELYLNLFGCPGIDDGLYRYSPQRHGLERLEAPPRRRLGHSQATARSCAASGLPKAAILFASRFQRVSARYRSIAYALTLKHVGVLMQTMYLVATAMGLAGCAVGTGDTQSFEELTGLPFLEESAVGEFALW